MHKLIQKLGPVYDGSYPGKTGYRIRCLGGLGVSRHPIDKEILVDNDGIYDNLNEPLIITHESTITGWGKLDGPCYAIGDTLSIPIKSMTKIGYVWSPKIAK